MYSREWFKNNPTYERQARLKRKYGLTPEEVERMRVEQENKCPICTREFNDQRKFKIDHDHATGAVRGLLCNRCNAHLPMIENVEIRDSALRYLDRLG